MINQNILSSTIFKDPISLKIWVWCICKAKDNQFTFTRNTAEKELSINSSKIYRCIKNLQSLNLIEVTVSNKYSTITLLNSDLYTQFTDRRVNSKVNSKMNNQKPPVIDCNSNKCKDEKNKNEQVNEQVNEQPQANKIKTKIKPNIPSEQEFLNYAISNVPNVKESFVKIKYKAFVENGWKDGYNKDIINWKTKILNVILSASSSALDNSYNQQVINKNISFYKTEIENNTHKQSIDAYKQMVNLILTFDDNKPAKHVLNIPNQISYDNYVELIKEINENRTSKQIGIGNIIKQFSNNPTYSQNKTCLYTVITHWIKLFKEKNKNDYS